MGMKKNLVVLILFVTSFVGFLLLVYLLGGRKNIPDYQFSEYNGWWEIQSIDTVKFSRDVAREKAGDLSFVDTISKQCKLIAGVGATHVAIGTPYDDEFTPFLGLWVLAARRNGLKVWFRGNFSGWEGWFEYPSMTREEHIEKTRNFIVNNPELFEDGDIFTSCTECENGGPGDPRDTGDVGGHRQFLIDEYQVAGDAFEKIGKNVKPGYFSMNGDVAKLVMNKKTTRDLGGIVVIDHYVKNPENLAEDVELIAQLSGGKVILGEFGAPIPDIHGYMNEVQQSAWLKQLLYHLSSNENLVGVNYWTAFGGSTNLWEGESPRLAVKELSDYYRPQIFESRLVNELGFPIRDSQILIGNREILLANENIDIYYTHSSGDIKINALGYEEKVLKDYKGSKYDKVVLEKEEKNTIYNLLLLVRGVFQRHDI